MFHMTDVHMGRGEISLRPYSHMINVPALRRQVAVRLVICCNFPSDAYMHQKLSIDDRQPV